ncbi:hypothetical protein FNO01nite_29420 [Flavobacterium noncentrifugens]|uniref:DNA-binding transcriptional regulator, XRE-family HTH domain n=1 Tax=Flavobacterium noncentrifugens TaxID=1128970 RepID=A0A1G8Y130_9FLAO|nr:helix-turn-helix transcriptional regulator [Flavobacterium noncentrifugens]GEP52270.1 hypothetical protein FNO01nite_29420 [Flavobacterium noncentrifugens]SDJ96518.1 DNA-binding transcriptional regulator, XRE-family HTH domain [Flavobacterium noncentrifugens]
MKTNEKIFLKRLGSAIRMEREKLNISQEALGLEIGISKNQVGRIERAEHATSITILYKLAIFFQIEIKSFFD